jgi:hypothetical protein
MVTGVVGAFAAMVVSGAGVAAAAPDVRGATYSDAATEIEDDGGTPKVAVTVGSKLPQDECIVTNAWDAPFVRDAGDEYTHAEDEVMVSLNCDGGHATAEHPGASMASPAGREAKAAEEKAAAEEDELAEASTPDE